MVEVGIVGGGPGGLMAAWHLNQKCRGLARVTILESSERLGGKLVTRRFSQSGVVYEAGVAEIYDYSHVGPDPLQDLMRELGLKTVPMDSDTVVLGDRILSDLAAVERAFGQKTRRAIEDFRNLCSREISPLSYYESVSGEDNRRRFARMTGHDLLQQHVADATARAYLRVASHSDIAVPPHLTSGLNAIKNTLMDVDGYLRLCSIEGGIERLTEELARTLIASDSVDVSFGTLATRIGSTGDGRYRVTAIRDGQTGTQEFDLLILALPLSWLSTLQWDGEALERTMIEHIERFDRPGHYLRVTVLFETPFWRPQVPGAWWMSDAFNGCCVYDEGARHDVGPHGVLGWLIAGNDALALANLDDATLVRRVLDSLPEPLRHGRAQVREAAVHRWLASVNGIPGGFPCRDIRTNHIPEPSAHPGLLLVGDYLFDSTLNGVLDSADAATDLALGEIVSRHAKPAIGEPIHLSRLGRPAPRPQRIGRSYFENYRGIGPYREAWREFFDARYIVEMARLAFDLKNGFRILDAGAASGLTLEALHGLGVEAWGVENNGYIHAQTSAQGRAYNLFGDVTDLPFPDDHFDVVYETCLGHLPEGKIDKALAELHRVARKGVIFGSVTSELAVATLGRFDLLDGIKHPRTWWEWSELFFEHDYELALEAPDRLAAAWQRTLAADRGPGRWYEDEESLRYCYYRKAG